MRLGVVLLFLFSLTGIAPRAQEVLPTASIPALDGHVVHLPADLSHSVNLLVFGFSRGSQKETTAWGKRILNQIGRPPEIGFYEVADLSPVPGMIRGMVNRSLRNNSPEPLRPYFLTLTKDAGPWKRLTGYASDAPDAAYVLLVDNKGVVRWKTHAPDSDASAAALAEQVRTLRAATR